MCPPKFIRGLGKEKKINEKLFPVCVNLNLWKRNVTLQKKIRNKSVEKISFCIIAMSELGLFFISEDNKVIIHILILNSVLASNYHRPK